MVPQRLLRSRHGKRIVPVGVVGRTVPARVKSTLTIPLVGREGANWPVDGEEVVVDAKTRDLGVEVTEVAASEEGVVRVVLAGDDVRCAECDLLDLGEVVGGVAVECEGTDVLNGDEILRDELGGVKDVKVELNNQPQILWYMIL
jgi:hypothetical protein